MQTEKNILTREERAMEAVALFDVLSPKQRAAIAAYIESGGNVSKACRDAGITRLAWYTWKGFESNENFPGDPAFQAALPTATDLAAQRLIDAALDRAVDGVEREVGWYQGKPGGRQLEFSDRLLEKLLEARLPEFSRRLHVDLQGEVGVMKVPEKAEPEQWAAAAKDYQRRLLAGEVESDENGGGDE